MRDGWTEISISDLLEVSIGGVWGGDPGTDEIDVCVYRQTEFDDNGTLSMPSDAVRSITENQLKSRTLQPGDILMQKSAGTPTLPGRVVIVPSEIERNATCSNFLHLLRADSAKCVSHFLFWFLWFNHQSGRAFEFQRGTNIKNLDLNQYLAQQVLLPPLNEQRRIVDVMSFFDAYIDALQQQADSARTARNAVLHELLSAGINDWTETTLGEVAVFYNGKAYKQDELLASGKYRVLRVGNFFSNGNWYWSDLELDANKYCDFGDLLYAWSASFGPRIWTDEKVIYHYHIWKVEVKPLQVEKKFLYYWLEDDVQRMKRDAGTGSIMMHITKGEIEARAIALPPLGEQKRIVEIVSSMDDVIQSTKQAVTDAKVLRSGLLSDLLSGEHEIPASYDSLLGVA
jgi:restriction endonuclease S subunit